ncbi:unnamed protein product [Paramecium primaurelia]|uniref:HSF-type DNA-binding domain-containing protein n=1 Tax=Paramecium primaurelia TaxID=5886 RepID=A0A8S1MRX3_PARPR|nr:unnamed protein product [Paramecium primaurelia]
MQYSKMPVFLIKLKSMLEDQCNQHIISWNDQGNKVIIHQIDEFKSSILPLYFKTTNYSSFQKQLNNYGFKNFRQSAKQCEFYNEYWTHDYKRIHQIIRKRNIQEDVNSTSTFMSSLLLLISNQKQLMANIEMIHQQQSMISQNIYNLHTESMKQQDLITNLPELQI